MVGKEVAKDHLHHEFLLSRFEFHLDQQSDQNVDDGRVRVFGFHEVFVGTDSVEHLHGFEFVPVGSGQHVAWQDDIVEYFGERVEQKH